MAENKVKLYGSWRSPFSTRVKIALKIKGVEYEYIEEDLLNKSPDLLRFNPVHKKIPVLVHGTKAVAESQVILEYIDEAWASGTPILPQDPYQRAVARFWAKFMDDKLFPAVYKYLVIGEDQALEEAVENLKILDKELEGKRFFGGESVGFVDIVGDIGGYWVGVFEEAVGKVLVTEEAFPSVCKWRDEFVSCGVVQECLPGPRDKLVAVFRDRIPVIRGKKSN